MLEEIKNIKTDIKSLKSFGITIGIVLLVIAGILYYKEQDSYKFFLYAAGFFIGFGYLIPSSLKPIYLIWMVFALLLGWFMTRIILSLLFYLVITPIGFISRIFGKDFIELKRSNKLVTYWNLRDSKIEEVQNYERQF